VSAPLLRIYSNVLQEKKSRTTPPRVGLAARLKSASPDHPASTDRLASPDHLASTDNPAGEPQEDYQGITSPFLKNKTS